MPAAWQADATSTVPPLYVTTSQEDVTLAFDTTPLLVSGGAPSAPASLLYRVVDNGADEAVALADTPTVAGNTINQRVRSLVADTTYRLRITFTTTGNKRSLTTILHCVE